MTPGKRNACAVTFGSVAVTSDRSQICTGVGEATKASSAVSIEPRPRRTLTIVSDTPYYLEGGQAVGWGLTT